MSNEFQVVFHNIDQSEALIDNVNKRIQKLQRFSNDIIGGRVVLDSPHNNHHKGKVFSVVIEIHTSGREVVVKQGQHDKSSHEDIYVAVRDAFNAAERQLKAVDKKHRGLVPGMNGYGLDGLNDIADTAEEMEASDENYVVVYEDRRLQDSVKTMKAGIA